jgi:hypothetical protein
MRSSAPQAGLVSAFVSCCSSLGVRLWGFGLSANGPPPRPRPVFRFPAGLSRKEGPARSSTTANRPGCCSSARTRRTATSSWPPPTATSRATCGTPPPTRANTTTSAAAASCSPARPTPTRGSSRRAGCPPTRPATQAAAARSPGRAAYGSPARNEPCSLDQMGRSDGTRAPRRPAAGGKPSRQRELSGPQAGAPRRRGTARGVPSSPPPGGPLARPGIGRAGT